MNSCERCKTELSDDLTRCPQCGREVGEPETSTSEQVHQLLADANIRRIRREYQAAVDKCTEAIQLDSDNPEVHSLLGDIYASQGNLREAARWYEIAIEMRPDCAIEVNKLSHIKDRLEKLGETEAAEVWPPAKSRGWMDSSLRYFIIACALAVVIFVAVGVMSWLSNINSGSDAVEQPVKPSSNPTRPESEAAPPPPDTSVRPRAEQTLLYQLATSQVTTGRHIIVEDVKIDPRTQVAVISFWNSKQPSNPTRAGVFADAAAVAKGAFAVNKKLRGVTVRVVVNAPGTSGRTEPHLALVCDFTRSAAGFTIEQLTRQLPRQAISDIWWNKEVFE